MIRFAQAQPQSNKRLADQLGTSRNDLRSVNGAKTFVKVHDSAERTQIASPQQNYTVTSPGSPSGTICGVESRAAHGQVAPNTNGGTLNPVAFINPTTVNASGRVAFNSQVDGSDRNQGVFVADSDGTISAIAIGCGGLGGGGDTTSMCGDASPIGGHFGGFFFGTVFTPDINDAGDVLFFCDVNGGDSRRALFLYQAASGEIVKVAAVGDPSPIGGTFGAVGPGSINNNGKVVFLASPVGETVNSNLFMWDNGVVTKVAAIGDPAPGGGTFSGLGTESFGFQDGTFIPVGPVPDINDSDQIAFRAIVSGGITERGIVVRTGQVDEWYVKVPDPTPLVGPTLICRPLQLTTPDKLLSLLITIPLPKPSTLVGLRELLEIGEKSSCSSILSTVDNALAWRSPVIRCRQSMRQGTSCSGLILIATGQPTALCLG